LWLKKGHDRIGKTAKRVQMPKRATGIHLSERDQKELERITKRHKSEQRHVLRAQIIVLAAQGRSNAAIACELEIGVDTVRKWRDRWAALSLLEQEPLRVMERLEDAPRSGKPSKYTQEQRCQLAMLACEAPSHSGRPISQWTGREIAEEMQVRGIVEQISPRHAARLLKKMDCNRTASAIG
jgi:putative transposase